MTRGRAIVTAVVAAVAMYVGLRGPLQPWFHRASVERDVARQRRVLIDELTSRPRPIQSRTTWSRAPGPAVGDGVTHERQALSPDGLLALATLDKYAAETPAALHATGVAWLMLGDPARSVDTLQRASERLPEDLDVTADLAAAYLERGEPGDRVRALDLSDAAAGGASAGFAGRFNLALGAARLLTPLQAEGAWQAALAGETDPAWRVEIGRQLTLASDRSRAAKDSTSVRWLRVLDDVAPRWARACIAGDVPAVRAAEREAQSLADALSGAGDGAAASVTAPMRTSDADRCNASFARGLEIYLDARAAYRADDLVGARTAYGRYLQDSASFSPALTLEAETYAAIAEYFTTRAATTVDRLETIRLRAERQGFPRLSARASWMLGYVHQDRSSFQKAIDAYRQAIDAASRAHDRETVAAVQALSAATLDWMGDYRAGWTMREQALGQLAEVADPRVLYTIEGTVTRAALRDGQTRAALRFSEEALRSVRAFASPARLAEAEIERGRIASRSALDGVTAEAVAAAETAAARVTAPIMAGRLRAQIDEIRASLSVEPAQSIEHLTRAIDSYRQAGADVALAHLYLARARAWRRQNDPRASGDLQAGLKVFEDVRSTLGTARWRISYFDEGWELFDEAIKLELDAGDARAALAFVERAHGRELVEALRRSRPETPPQQSDPAPLDRETRILRLLALDDRLAIWTISGPTVTVHVERIPSTQIQAQVSDVLACLSHASAGRGCDPLLAGLYDSLVRQPLHDVPPGTRLILIPEGMLQMVPFAALRDRVRGKYLVEDFPLSLAATPALRQPLRDADRVSDGSRLLVIVAAPGSGGRALPDAAREAADIGAGYRRPMVLDMAQGDKTGVLATLTDRAVDIVHFSGHAIANPENPDLSRLVLDTGSGPGTKEDLFAYEISRLRLSNLKVVLLAACETAVGRTYRSEGVMSLARAFLEAGVSSVVATLWDIEDAPARRLFTAVHRYLRSGLPAADAVRAAQLEMMAQEQGYLWAAVVATTAGPL